MNPTHTEGDRLPDISHRRRAVMAWVVLAAAVLLPGVGGQIAVYLWLGLVPGLAVARLLLPRFDSASRRVFGLALSPLVAATLAWSLTRAGLGFVAACRITAALSALAWLALELGPRPRSGRDASREDLPRRAQLWGAGLACAVTLPGLVNPYIRVRSDTWTHIGIVWEILHRGMPPQDPYFAGLRLNYVWFYDLFLAVTTGVRGDDPLISVLLFNAATAFAMTGLFVLLARAVTGRATAAAGAAFLLVFGFNAGAYLLWPLRLARAIIGGDGGLATVRSLLGQLHLGTAMVVEDLHAPRTLMASFLDKHLLGTALNYGYLMMLLCLWGVLRAWRRGGWTPRIVTGVAVAGMFLFHAVVALSVTPVLLAALAIVWLAGRRWPWIPTRSLPATAAAIVAGALLALPYLLSITVGWRAGGGTSAQRLLVINPGMLWSIATSCAFVLPFAAREALAGRRDRRAETLLLASIVLGLVGFACVVDLTVANEAKFLFEIFAVAALLAAPRFHDWLAGLLRRHHVVGAALLTLVFLVPPLVTLTGFAGDPGRHTAPELKLEPGETTLYGWVRERTEPRAVLVDSSAQNPMIVRGERQLYLGSGRAPRFAFPVAETRRREEVMADLYGPAARLDHDARSLAGLTRPAYVVFRPRRGGASAGGAGRLRERPDLFESVYDAGGFRVYRLRH